MSSKENEIITEKLHYFIRAQGPILFNEDWAEGGEMSIESFAAVTAALCNVLLHFFNMACPERNANELVAELLTNAARRNENTVQH